MLTIIFNSVSGKRRRSTNYLCVSLEVPNSFLNWNVSNNVQSDFCSNLHVRRLAMVWFQDNFFFSFGAAGQRGPWPPLSWGFLDHTQRRIAVGRTPLDEWSARRRDLYVTTHVTHNTQTSITLVGFEPTISAGERPQIYALDRAATGTGRTIFYSS